ncbi:osteopetrosis-associated transmembrane protein 1 [Phlebotomus papatasi]|uniref:osteopetrosis-associated transmembrane protein 1 n=1 Tax=Phlebotomus papatasi TaxID=29031 RepID=UPI002483E747|nr:osteopetrosis-associated transmembrane protein 1 [Phlebotomus papatasi]
MKSEQFLYVLVFFSGLAVESSFCQNLGSQLSRSSKDPPVPCQNHLDQFERKSKDFTTIILKNAVPVTYCTKSVDDYLAFEQSYKNLTESQDKNNVSCRSLYFNVDRLGVVETMYTNLQRVWKMGFCDDCYSNTSTSTLSNTTNDFFYYWKEINDCITNSSQSDPCLKCMSHYQKLNSFFDGIKKEKGDQICFDLQDAMNRTRILWSVKLNCCRDRAPSMLSFTIISAIVGLLPGIFYIAFYFWRRHQDRFDFLSDTNSPLPEPLIPENSPLQNLPENEDEPGPSGATASVLPRSTGAIKKEKTATADESDDDLIDCNEK